MDIVYVGANNWHTIRQRSQHIAAGLAEQHRVLHVDPPLYSIPGYLRDSLLHRSQRPFRTHIERVRKQLWTVQLPPLLLGSTRWNSINRANVLIAARILKGVIARLQFEEVLLWIANPFVGNLVGFLNERFVCYDCMDNYPFFFTGRKAAFVDALERSLFDKADVVFASSDDLYRKCRSNHSNVHLVRNGVEIDHFAAARVHNVPDDLAALPRPILGYVGMVRDWVDLSLLRQLAGSNPQWSVVLVGPIHTDVSDLQDGKNLYLLGERSYREMAAYVQAFDVCLIPFKRNRLTEGVNPVKMYEYFALGKPVVSTALPEVNRYADVCYVAANAEDFQVCVARALEEDTNPLADDLRNRRRQIATQNSWQSRVAEIRETIEMNPKSDTPACL